MVIYKSDSILFTPFVQNGIAQVNIKDGMATVVSSDPFLEELTGNVSVYTPLVPEKYFQNEQAEKSIKLLEGYLKIGYDREKHSFNENVFLDHDYLGYIFDAAEIGYTLAYIGNSFNLGEIFKWYEKENRKDEIANIDIINFYRNDERIYMIFVPDNGDDSIMIFNHLSNKSIGEMSFIKHVFCDFLTLADAEDISFLTRTVVYTHLSNFTDYLIFMVDERKGLLQDQISHYIDFEQFIFNFSGINNLSGKFASELLLESIEYRARITWYDYSLIFKDCSYQLAFKYQLKFIELLNNIIGKDIRYSKRKDILECIYLARNYGYKSFEMDDGYYTAIPFSELTSVTVPDGYEHLLREDFFKTTDHRNMFDNISSINITEAGTLDLLTSMKYNEEYFTRSTLLRLKTNPYTRKFFPYKLIKENDLKIYQLLGYDTETTLEYLSIDVQVDHKSYTNKADETFTKYYITSSNDKTTTIAETNGPVHPKLHKLLEVLASKGFFFTDLGKNVYEDELHILNNEIITYSEFVKVPEDLIGQLSDVQS